MNTYEVTFELTGSVEVEADSEDDARAEAEWLVSELDFSRDQVEDHGLLEVVLTR